MNTTSKRNQSLLFTATCATLVALAAPAQAGPDDLCGAFEAVLTPGQGEFGKVLTSIAVQGSTGFATGRFYPQGSGSFVPLLYRYDGAHWMNQSLPPLSAPAHSPVLMAAGMSPATGNTAWIVGWVTASPAPVANYWLPLMARWRNGAFDRIDTPQLQPTPFGARTGFAYDVAVISDNDVWVVGESSSFGGATGNIAMALHWNGSGWEEISTPTVGDRTNTFDAVSASASDNVWAAGTSRSIGDPYFGLLQRWDGSSWSVVSHPALSAPYSQFYDVLAFSPSDVWVAGAVNYTEPILIHWDGSSWQSALLPGNNGIVAMVGSAADDIWAIAADGASSLMHWDGASWTLAASPPPPAGQVDSMRALMVAGPCDVWAAGSQMNSSGFRGTYIEHLVASEPACPADFSGDGVVNSQDFFDFLVAFFAGNADFNTDGVTNSQDFFDFLAAFFVGCP